MSIDTIASKELKAEENYNEILRQEQEMKEKEAHLIFHQGINREYYSNPATDLCLVEKLTEYVVQVFKYENSLTIEQKINFTSLLIYYRCYIDLEEFYEEECHLSLVKWIYSNLDSFNPFRSKLWARSFSQLAQNKSYASIDISSSKSS